MSAPFTVESTVEVIRELEEAAKAFREQEKNVRKAQASAKADIERGKENDLRKLKTQREQLSSTRDAIATRLGSLGIELNSTQSERTPVGTNLKSSDFETSANAVASEWNSISAFCDQLERLRTSYSNWNYLVKSLTKLCDDAENKLPSETNLSAVQKFIDSLSTAQTRLDRAAKALPNDPNVDAEKNEISARCSSILEVAISRKEQVLAIQRDESWVSALKIFKIFCEAATTALAKEKSITEVSKQIDNLKRKRVELEGSESDYAKSPKIIQIQKEFEYLHNEVVALAKERLEYLRLYHRKRKMFGCLTAFVFCVSALVASLFFLNSYRFANTTITFNSITTDDSSGLPGEFTAEIDGRIALKALVQDPASTHVTIKPVRLGQTDILFSLTGYVPIRKKLSVDYGVNDLGHLVFTRAKGTLLLSSELEPDHISVIRVGGGKSYDSPLTKGQKLNSTEVSLPTGQYQITISAGLVSQTQTATVKTDSESKVNFDLPRGGLTMTGYPRATQFSLLHNGQNIMNGELPATISAITPGEYEIDYSYQGEHIKKQITIDAGKTVTCDATLPFGGVQMTVAGAKRVAKFDLQRNGISEQSGTLPEALQSIKAGDVDIIATDEVSSQTQHLVIIPSNTSKVHFDFVYGGATITSDPVGATLELSFNGHTLTNTTPFHSDSLLPGTYNIRLTYRGASESESLLIEQGKTASLNVIFPKGYIPVPVIASNRTDVTVGTNPISAHDPVNAPIGDTPIPVNPSNVTDATNPNPILTPVEAPTVNSVIIVPQSNKPWILNLPGNVQLEMTWIAPGAFTMGSPSGIFGGERDRTDSETQHRVILTRGFWLGKYEVTQRQWADLMGSNPSQFKNKGLDAPVEQVSWLDVMEFCQRVTDRERADGHLPKGYHYILPTEAQWEYACRAGTTGPFSNNGDLSAIGWYNSDTEDSLGTRPVGTKLPNGWGLYDMQGNVWEWCADWYAAYPQVSVTDPVGPASGLTRVIRGGSWNDAAGACRAASRGNASQETRSNVVGFRLALIFNPND